MTVTSDPVSPVRPVGSNVVLTCMAVLSSSIDVQVTVRFQISRTNPAGSSLSTTTPSMSGSTYTSRAVVSSFGRDQSGVYTCTAVVSSTSLFLTDSSTSGTVRVTTGNT